MRSGGQVLVDQLVVHGASMVFCVPGESYLAALDAFVDIADRIRVISTRIEIGAGHMAEAHGKLTGQPGICFVSRGPGASHAMIAVHTAMEDATPMILFVGQIDRGTTEREAFQEIDIKAMFGHTAKWAAEIRDARRIPEMVSRAFHTAVSGRPGPVVLGLPEDMLMDRVEVADMRPYRAVRASPGPQDIAEFGQLLAASSRPMMLVGGGGWTDAARQALMDFSEKHAVPVCASFRCQDRFDNNHPHYLGDLSLGIMPGVADAVAKTDLLITVGARMDELTTQSYTLIKPPTPVQPLVHIHPDPEELGRVYQPILPVNAGPEQFLTAVFSAVPLAEDRLAERRQWIADARARYEQNAVPDATPGSLDLAEAIKTIARIVPTDTIITCDAGNFAGWLNRYYRFGAGSALLGPMNGSMGYSVPAGVAAKLIHPDRTVLSFVGDGGFMMTGQELATAMQYDAPLVIIVVNNGLYGTIRMHQEREFPGRTPATTLRNPDFAALAQSYGAFGETVSETSQFEAAFERALAAGRPALLELRIDPEAITHSKTLTGIRQQALADKQSGV
ncbi:thiamine pyrophosphate-binding protein [Croceicoccus bisphenolivorans]|uniref:thiamine pyrophosphate-binding protein n=1 Tax=Croceicoccus bisphenolivorans TaxID=1783232 RepID=UPI000AFF0918|nr:thiamine pyrophosphate-binding protein [Croceicoccus bisphenolivorans]